MKAARREWKVMCLYRLCSRRRVTYKWSALCAVLDTDWTRRPKRRRARSSSSRPPRTDSRSTFRPWRTSRLNWRTDRVLKGERRNAHLEESLSVDDPFGRLCGGRRGADETGSGHDAAADSNTDGK